MENKDRFESKEIVGKQVVSKSGRKIGMVKDLLYDTRSGEIVYFSIKDPTPYARELRLEKDEEGDLLAPYAAVISVGDFVVIAEEDLI
ncbi:MAG: PRC-barrel domain-containing protein [Candidatus Parvarchaeota archaeon]|nr:PRC-barrel domain-containing protein [Candidatus Rehaiarchaeum fermentans]MCW1293408.1 PRC-barrel domain-containing protein [Candidatus Rehaiarchaeum fermentans]